jgi:toxin ParE1/3/4
MSEVFYHPRIPAEVREILDHYSQTSDQLADEFYEELMDAIGDVQRHPGRHHFDPSGRRRCNLKRFPYHFLFRIFPDYIRVTVVKHNSRSPGFGARRR